MYVEKERGNYMDQTYMKEQPVLKLILSMALPMVLSMMVSSLYNIVDSFFIARISEDAMTALSLVYPVQNLVNAVMIGFGIGINAVISFYLGAQDKEMADRAATQGMLLGTIHGIGFMILGIAVMRPFLQMFTEMHRSWTMVCVMQELHFYLPQHYLGNWYLRRHFRQSAVW